MKTKNDVQKTILRSAAVVISFVLISYTVSAQDFWKRLLVHSSFNQIAMAMAESSENSVDNAGETAAFYFLDAAEYDAPMELENWMLQEDAEAFHSLGIVTETENSMELEEWMLADVTLVLDDETEEPMALENWMTSGLDY